MPINGRVQEAAEHLEQLLEQADPVQDRDSIIWALGFLTALLRRLEMRVPGLSEASTLRERTSEIIERLRKQLPEDLTETNPDSLEQIERELRDEEPGDAPVPARRKPGPKGLSGGAALPLPFSDGSDFPV